MASKEVVTTPTAYKYRLSDYIGKRVGKWTIGDEEVVKTYSRRYWKCACICGHEQWVRDYLLRNNKTSGCMSCVKATNSNIYSFKSWYVYQIKLSATKRNLEFSIALDELEQVWQAQDGKCALSGVPIYMGDRFLDMQTASLDRIDSSIGYVSGNVQWVHKKINILKTDLSQKEFIDICHAVAQHCPPNRQQEYNFDGGKIHGKLLRENSVDYLVPSVLE